jgi:acetyl esterase
MAMLPMLDGNKGELMQEKLLWYAFLLGTISMQAQCPDTQTQAVLDEVASWGFAPAHTRSVNDLRTGKSAYGYESTASIKEVKDVTIQASSGPLDIRLYIPHGDGPFPILINLHGGGWVLGSLGSNRCTCEELCSRTPCMVIAVDYHLAPEAKFPVAFNDCYEATEWVVNNIARYNGDASKIVVGGMSAGGNLAAAVALKARDEQSFKLAGQLLMVPVVDCNFETESYKKYAQGYLLTSELMKWYWNHYLSCAADGMHPYASPLRATSHAHLPPALIMTAEFDPLRDEAYAYATALTKAGVVVEHHVYPSIHGFVSMADRIDAGQRALDVMAAYLRDVFAKEN